MNRNTVKAKLNQSGSITLSFTRKDGWGAVVDRFRISVPRKALERALREATIEVPWKSLER